MENVRKAIDANNQNIQAASELINKVKALLHPEQAAQNQSEEQESAQEAQNQASQESSTSKKPVVAVYGLLNAGKSYLLNMLSSHTDEEFFKCSDARETVELKTFEGPDFIYLDTPGLDANNDDNLTAFQGRDQADIILFVHQASSELDKLEVDFLKDVQQKLGKSMEQSVVLVVSKIDNLGNQEDLQPLVDKIVKQWEEILGFSTTPFAVSGKRYLAGLQNSKDVLVEKSGVKQLQEQISKLAKECDFTAFKQEREQIKLADYIPLLEQMRQQIIDSANNIERELSDSTVGFCNYVIPDVDEIRQTNIEYKSNEKERERIEDELEDVKWDLDSL